MGSFQILLKDKKEKNLERAKALSSFLTALFLRPGRSKQIRLHALGPHHFIVLVVNDMAVPDISVPAIGVEGIIQGVGQGRILDGLIRWRITHCDRVTWPGNMITVSFQPAS